MLAASVGAWSQQRASAPANAVAPMGSVATTEAKITGGLEVHGQRAQLITNASVTALNRTAWIDLARGGGVAVCATSEFHLLRSGTADALMFSLDRGAVEIRSFSRLQDAIITPDLRFTMVTTGPLDLRMRVTREGDTCVENHGDRAPVLNVVEGFGTGSYQLAAGQHVMFEHGSLREVVDHERSNCGCPELARSVAEFNGANGTSTVTAAQAEAMNPFPAEQSAGLSSQAEAVKIVPAKPAAGTTAMLSYAGGGAAAAVARPAASNDAGQIVRPAMEAPQPEAQPSASAAVAEIADTPPPSPPGVHDLAHLIGRFFKVLFHVK